MGVVIISVSLRDHKGDSAAINYFLQDGVSPTDLDNYITAVIDSLDLVTGAVIEGVFVTEEVVPFGTAPKTTPSADVDLERGVNFGYGVLGLSTRHTIRVPALEDGIGDGETVDPLVAPQSVYNGIVPETTLTAVPCNRSGVALVDGSVIDPALITFHKAIS